MRVLIPIRKGWMVWLGLLFLAHGSVLGRELELTGDYDDEGTVSKAAPDQPAGVVSLHALLSLEFVPGLARLLHDQTGVVKIKHEAGMLEVAVVNREGEVIWQERWKQGEGYQRSGDTLSLHFRPGRKDKEEFLLNFETVTAYRLLQVEVVRLTPTVLGPVRHPMGTYLFHRAE